MATKILIDTKTFIRFWLVPLGFGLIAFFLFKASFGLSIIGAALFLALAISPLVRRIAKHLPGKSRTIPIALSYIVVVGFISAFLAIVIPTIINESVKFLSGLPELVNTAVSENGFINQIGQNFGISSLQDQVISFASSASDHFANNLGNILTSSLTTISSIIAVLILSLVLAFFMLTEGPTIVKTFWRNLPQNKRTLRAEHTIHLLAATVSQYVSGAISVALINACATAVSVFIISLCFNLDPGLAFPFGLITGVFSLIPMFGSFFGGIIVALLLGFNTFWAGVAFLIYTIIYLQIESNIISPNIQGKSMRLPALVILSAVTIGVYTFGLIGAIISIPIAGCIKILIDEYLVDWFDDGKINGSTTKSSTKSES